MYNITEQEFNEIKEKTSSIIDEVEKDIVILLPRIKQCRQALQELKFDIEAIKTFDDVYEDLDTGLSHIRLF